MDVLNRIVSSFSRKELDLEADVKVLNEPVIVAVSSSAAVLEFWEAFSSSAKDA